MEPLERFVARHCILPILVEHSLELCQQGHCTNLILEYSCKGSAHVYSLPRVEPKGQDPYVQYLYMNLLCVC